MIQFDDHIFQMGWFNHQVSLESQTNPFLGIISHKYPLYRAYIGISHKGTLVQGYIQLSPDWSYLSLSLYDFKTSLPCRCWNVRPMATASAMLPSRSGVTAGRIGGPNTGISYRGVAMHVPRQDVFFFDCSKNSNLSSNNQQPKWEILSNF